MRDDHFYKLQDIAPIVGDLVTKPDAIVFYELLSGGLVWTDEIPSNDEDSQSCSEYLRPLFKYRSSIIIGCHEERYRDYWDEGLRLFPQWPGFLPWRRSPEYKEIYEQQKASALTSIDELFDP